MNTKRKVAALTTAALITLTALTGCSTTATHEAHETSKPIITVGGSGGDLKFEPTVIVEVQGSGGTYTEVPTYDEWMKNFDGEHPLPASEQQAIYLKDLFSLSDSEARGVNKALACLAPAGDGSYSAVIVLIQQDSKVDLATVRAATRSTTCVPLPLNPDKSDNLFVLHHALVKGTDKFKAPLSLTTGRDGFRFVSLEDASLKTPDFTWDISSVKYLTV